jgi:hypothetical protein
MIIFVSSYRPAALYRKYITVINILFMRRNSECWDTTIYIKCISKISNKNVSTFNICTYEYLHFQNNKQVICIQMLKFHK